MNAPALFVLLTQAAVVAWFCLLGAFGGSLVRSSVGTLAAARAALWLGVGIGTLTVVIVGLFAATKSTATVVVAALVTVGAIVAWALIRMRRGDVEKSGPTFTRSWWVLVPIAGLALLAVATAHIAFGSVINYDTGLYHLNAIQYAADYPTIHGLANLHPRLGTNVSAFDIAAFLGSTPWGADSFRLLVGVYLLVLSTDVALRLLDGRTAARRLPGTYLLLVSLAVAIPGVWQQPNYNVTGSSPDTIALALALAAGAYLVDALVTRERVWVGLAVVTTVLAASVRTQLWVMAVLTVIVLIVDTAVRRRAIPGTGSRAFVFVASIVSGVLAVALMVRDALLSGWLLFPMTYLPLPVDWRVPQVTADSTREWIMSWARDRSAGPDQTLTSWYWVPAWLRESATEWSIAGAIGLLSLALVLWLAARRPRTDPKPDSLRAWLVPVLAILPALGATLVWFVTAPDPRFAWGPLVLLGAVPAALALRRLAGTEDQSPVFPIAAGLLSLAVIPVAAASLVAIHGDPGGDQGFEFRTYSFGPIDVVASVANLPNPATRSFGLVDGNTVQIPTESDQCYEVFPLCTPYESSTLRLIGTDVADGFRSD